MIKAVLIAALLLSCSNATDSDPNTDIQPITNGSRWVYDITEYSPIYRTEVEETREVKGIDSLGYSLIHISKDNILGIYQYIYKDDGLYIVNNMTDVIDIKYPVSVGETFSPGITQIKLVKNDTTIEVPSGTFKNCYYFTYHFNGALSQKRFYKVGIGMVQRIIYSTNNGNVIQDSKLKSYLIK
ncbi:MAG: hypothetical protein KDD94_04130 [Calditrichaeota bacterium]|nr:hypothetical protein [Calditrichota bacterium]